VQSAGFDACVAITAKPHRINAVERKAMSICAQNFRFLA
jgi:hypothetical protein